MSTNADMKSTSQNLPQTLPQTLPPTLSQELTLQFFSLTEENIPQERINAEIIPVINNMILEMCAVKKKIKAGKFDDANDESDTIIKMKVIFDLCAIYKNPMHIRMIKEAQEAQEERERLEKQKNEAEIRRRENMRTFDSATNLLDFWNSGNKFSQFNKDKESESDVDSKLSDISDNELDNEEIDRMIDKSYTSIKKNSTVYRMTCVQRFNNSYLDPSDDENDDEPGNTKESNETEESKNTNETNETNETNSESKDKKLEKTSNQNNTTLNTNTTTNTNINVNANINTDINTDINTGINTGINIGINTGINTA
jgi:hypothetical protein